MTEPFNYRAWLRERNRAQAERLADGFGTPPHQFHDGESCFPGCPAWTTSGPVCHATITTIEGKRVCFRPLEDGVCPVHGDPNVIAKMLTEAEDKLAGEPWTI